MVMSSPNRRDMLGALMAPAAALVLPRAAGAEPQAVSAALAPLLTDALSAEALHARVSTRMAPAAAALRAAVREWGALYPQQARDTLARADLARHGMLTLDGTGGKPAFVGDPVGWTRNPTGEPEYTSVLNRMGHWIPLLRAWMLTGQAAYADKVVAELDDWIARCPPPLPAQFGPDLSFFHQTGPWRALEVGIRMGEAWAFMFKALATSDWLPPERLARLALAMHQHGRVLAEVSPRLWPAANHNHYLFETTGLLQLAALLPELKDAAAWQAQAWREVERCALAQLTAEGGQIEGAPHYHNICLLFFCNALEVGRGLALPLGAGLRARVVGALDYCLHSCRPDGANVPWGDSDATNSPAEALLAAASALDDWQRLAVFKSFASPGRIERAIGRLYPGVAQPAAWRARVLALPPARSTPVFWARALDQAMLRSDWSATASSVFFGCHTPIFNGHAHADPASFDYCGLGRPLLVDPGRYTYTEGPARRAFKSAAWHNTVTVNGREPFEYLSSWSAGPQKEGRLVAHYRSAGGDGEGGGNSRDGGEAFEAFEALNRNFDPVTHRRLLLMRPGGEVLLVDWFDGLADSDSVELWFHIDSTSVKWMAETQQAVSADAGRPNLGLSCKGQQPLSGRLLEGFVSETMDQRRASTRLQLQARPAAARAAFVTHLQAFGQAPRALQLQLQVQVQVQLQKEAGSARPSDGASVRFGAVGGPLYLWQPDVSVKLLPSPLQP